MKPAISFTYLQPWSSKTSSSISQVTTCRKVSSLTGRSSSALIMGTSSSSLPYSNNSTCFSFNSSFSNHRTKGRTCQWILMAWTTFSTAECQERGTQVMKCSSRWITPGSVRTEATRCWECFSKTSIGSGLSRYMLKLERYWRTPWTIPRGLVVRVEGLSLTHKSSCSRIELRCNNWMNWCTQITTICRDRW